jgi:hypothetical protein
MYYTGTLILEGRFRNGPSQYIIPIDNIDMVTEEEDAGTCIITKSGREAYVKISMDELYRILEDKKRRSFG